MQCNNIQILSYENILIHSAQHEDSTVIQMDLALFFIYNYFLESYFSFKIFKHYRFLQTSADPHHLQSSTDTSPLAYLFLK